MISFYHPPLRGSSGAERSARFAQYLPQFGWEPLVLSAYSPGQQALDDGVHRSLALDASVAFAIGGRYPRSLALPDRYSTWLLTAVPKAMALVRRYRPSMLWSTYPIASAQLIGSVVQSWTGLPWVADVRDPMLERGFPADASQRRAHQWLEQRIARQSRVVCCTSPSAAGAWRERHPGGRVALIANGFDEASFGHAAVAAPTPFVLLHAGLLYPSERDPRALFAALASLRPSGFVLRLRASGHEPYLRSLILQYGLQGTVELAPALPYAAALAEMQSVHALLLMQSASCNAQIPAKFYEYLRARRPILALTDRHGDTAAAMRSAGLDSIAPLDNVDAIAAALGQFIQAVRTGTAALPTQEHIAIHSRQARTGQLARLFDSCLETP